MALHDKPKRTPRGRHAGGRHARRPGQPAYEAPVRADAAAPPAPAPRPAQAPAPAAAQPAARRNIRRSAPAPAAQEKPWQDFAPAHLRAELEQQHAAQTAVGLARRPAAPAAPRKAPPRKRRAGWLAPVVLLLLLAAGGVGLHGFLAGSYPANKGLPAPAQPRVVRLDEAWTDLLSAQAGGRAMRQTIDRMLAGVKALPGQPNALAWRPRAFDGRALFRDGTGTVESALNLHQDDVLLARFDAVQYLVKAAGEAGLALYLETDPNPDAADAALLQKHALQPLTHIGGSQWQTDAAQLIFLPGDPEGAADALLNPHAGFDGAILGDWSALAKDPIDAALLGAFWAGGPAADVTAAWPGKAVAQTLGVTYPAKTGATLYTKQVFLMGTSDPTLPLTLDGEDLPRYGQAGVWGVLVDLKLGENTFALRNGETTLAYTVKRAKAKTTKAPRSKPDGTPGKEAVGKKVVITDPIASALEKCWDAASVRQTLYQGAAAAIVDAVEYDTGTKLTHAYKLSTGDYVRAAACEIRDDVPDAAFTGARIYEDAASRSTVIAFAGSGSPAVFHTWEENTLTLTLLSARLTGTLPASDRFAVSVQQPGDDLTLRLTFDDADPLYGWTVNYKDGTTYLYLKHKPALQPGSAPLAGVTVMLDAGHGGSDDGAMGSAGMAAPVEKEVNLALALAARTRLEQLGATVVMTRADDSFPSLGDRVTAMNEQHPDLFLSLHHNSVELTRDVNRAGGTEAYWFYDEGEPLARRLVENVAAAAGKAGADRAVRDVYYGRYYVTRSNICPAVLLEVGFMTNPAEYEQVIDPAVLNAEGMAIARSVYEFIRDTGR